MDKYFKVKVSFWERLLFLFTGILPLSAISQVKDGTPEDLETLEWPTEPVIRDEADVRPYGDVKGTYADTSNTYKPPEKEHVPFFEINTDEVESNL